MTPVRLAGPRVVLRELTPEDYAAARAYVTAPDFLRYLPIPSGEEDTRTWLAASIAQQTADPRSRFELAITLDGAMVGATGIGLTEHGNAEIGWALAPAVWGRGLAAEAARLLITFAIETLGVRRVRARCDTRNTRSQRVMEKLFLRREALFAQDEPATEGGYRSSYLYAALAEELRAFTAFPAMVRARCGLDVTIERPSDLKEIHELQRTVGRAMVEDHGMDHWAEPYPLEEIQADARRRETYAIRSAAGAVVASFTIGLSPMWLSEDAMPWPDAEQPLWLHRLMVDPGLQSSGLGSAMMTLAETLGRARGCDALRLETRADFDAVQRFYARNGYVEVFRKDGQHHAWNALVKALR